MAQLDYPDRHFVNAAGGWLELGDSAEAARELRHLSKAAESHPDVLELRWRLAATQGDWQAALDIARAVTRAAPDRASGWIHKSRSLHELKRTEEARDVLLPMARKFPKDAMIAYNLARYSCQLGDLPQAREWIKRALKLRGKDELRKMALQDPNLERLRDYIDTL